MAAIRDVMSTVVVTVAPTATIAEAATMMGTSHVGSSLVIEGEELVGIFTERDVMRAVASDFDAEHHHVSEFMTRRPTTVTPEADVREALDTMLEAGFRHFPVVDGGAVVGVVSMRDLTRGVTG